MDSPVGDFDDKKLAWDLRIFYAMIVGKRMMKVDEAAESKDYSSWYKHLIYIYTTAFSRIDKDRTEIKKKYNTLHEETIKILNDNKKAYLKKDFDSIKIALVERQLLKLQHFVYRILHLSNQFGSEISIGGLR